MTEATSCSASSDRRGRYSASGNVTGASRTLRIRARRAQRSSGAARPGSGTKSISLARSPIRGFPEQFARSDRGCSWPRGRQQVTISPRSVRRRASTAFSAGSPPGTIPNNVNTVNYRLNDDGTFFTGMGFAQDGPTMAPGGYRFNGPLYDPSIPGSGGNHQGEFAGLPVFVRAPNGYIKENNLYAWASSPLERLSSFANGHFDISDSVRVTAQASVSRTQTQSSLGADGRQHQPVGGGGALRQPGLPRQQSAAVPRRRAGPQHLRHSGFAGIRLDVDTGRRRYRRTRFDTGSH